MYHSALSSVVLSEYICKVAFILNCWVVRMYTAVSHSGHIMIFSLSTSIVYSFDGILVFGLLFICTCAYLKKVPRLNGWLLSEKKGVWGVFYKGTINVNSCLCFVAVKHFKCYRPNERTEIRNLSPGNYLIAQRVKSL